MKVGVIGCFFGNPDLLSDVLAPWVELKRAGVPIVLGGINAQFKEYADLGYPNDDHETRSILEKHRTDFDELLIESVPLMEHEVRSRLLDRLKKHDVDLYWILDGDELYTVEQVRNILGYIERMKEFDYFHVHFKNILFDQVVSRDMFCPPRVIRAGRRGGVLSFTWDNEVAFGDGSSLNDGVPGIVPKRYAHVRHMTWRRAQARRKIDYSLRHFGLSIFREDQKTGEIVYNEEWFKKYRLPIPVRYPDGTVGTPAPSVEVVFSLSGSFGERSHRSLWSLVRMLLVFDRANDAFLELTILTPPGRSVPQELKSFLELFAIEVKYVTGDLSSIYQNSKADLFFLTDDAFAYASSALLGAYHSFWYFSKMLGKKEVAFLLVDNPALYEGVSSPGERVVRGTNSHWRTVSRVDTRGLFLPRELFSGILGRLIPDGAVFFSALPTLAVGLDAPVQPLYSGPILEEFRSTSIPGF